MRVFQRTLLASLACYLVAAGGMFGQMLFQAYRINLVLITIGGLWWLAWRLRRQKPFPATSLDLPIIAWLGVLLITSLSSADPRRSLETFVYYLVWVLLFYFLVDMERTGRLVTPWLSYILAAGILSFVIGYFELAYWYRNWLAIGGLGQLIPPATIRVGSSLGHANILAAFLNLLWPLALARLLTAPSRVMKIAMAVWCAAALGLIYLTSSRGGWLGAVAASGTLVLLLFFDQRDAVMRTVEWLKTHKRFTISILFMGLMFTGVIGVLLYRQVQNPSHPSGDPRGYIWSVASAMFRRQPLLGTGPGTYARAFLQTYSIPPGMLLLHAHNFLINSLGESGLLGAATTLWLGFALVWSAIRRWRAELPGKRTLLAGVLAALASLAVHSQFEVPQGASIINILTAVLMAQLVAPVEVDRRKGQAVGSTLLAVGWLTAAGLGLWSLWGYSALQHGVVAASGGDWATSATWMDEAVRRDTSLAYYRFQAGLAHGRLALDDKGGVRDNGELGKAIKAFENGLNIEDVYALNWANLGILRWAGGDHPAAMAALERAVALAPQAPDLHLLLGQAYEESGKKDQAFNQYQKALELRPELAKSPLFQQTIVKAEALSMYSPPALEPGWEALEVGDYTQAEGLFNAQLGLNTARAYLGLGLALAEQGRLEEAEKSLRTAAFIDAKDLAVKEALADVYDRMGRDALAARIRPSTKDWVQGEWDEQADSYQLMYLRMGLRMDLFLTGGEGSMVNPVNKIMLMILINDPALPPRSKC